MSRRTVISASRLLQRRGILPCSSFSLGRPLFASVSGTRACGLQQRKYVASALSTATGGVPNEAITDVATDLTVSDVYANCFAVFNEDAMVMFCPKPAMFEKGEMGKYKVKYEGSITCMFMGKRPGELKYNKEKKWTAVIGADGVGSILEIVDLEVEKAYPILTKGNELSVQVDPTNPEPVGIIWNSPKQGSEGRLHVRMPRGKFRVFQTLVANFIPAMYGWQVYTDPASVSMFLGHKSWSTRPTRQPQASIDDVIGAFAA